MNAILPDQGEIEICLLTVLIKFVHRMPEIDNRNVSGFSQFHDEIAALAESPIDTMKALHGGFEVFVVNGRCDENLPDSFRREGVGDSLNVLFESIDRLSLRVFGVLGNFDLRIETSVYVIHAGTQSRNGRVVRKHILLQPTHHARCGVARNAAV